jgi:hypothetical protein
MLRPQKCGVARLHYVAGLGIEAERLYISKRRTGLPFLSLAHPIVYQSLHTMITCSPVQGRRSRELRLNSREKSDGRGECHLSWTLLQTFVAQSDPARKLACPTCSVASRRLAHPRSCAGIALVMWTPNRSMIQNTKPNHSGLHISEDATLID